VQSDVLESIKGPEEDLIDRKFALIELFDQGTISVKEFQEAVRDLNVELTALDNTYSGGLENGLARMIQQSNELGTQVSDLVVDSFNRATDSIVNFAKTGELNVREFFASLFEQLLRLTTNQLFSQLLSGMGGGGGFGGLGSLFGGLGGLGGLFGFKEGGSFTVGGSGGPDSQLVAFKASPGEQVDIKTPQQQSGGSDRGASQPSPVNIRVVNVVNPSETIAAMSSVQGEKAILNAATDDDPPRIYTTSNSGFRSFADPGEDCAHIRTPGGQWVDVFNHGDYSTVDAYKNHEQGYYVWPYSSGGGNAGQEDSLIAWDIRPPPNYPDARIIIPLHFSGGVPEAGIIGIIDETYYVPGFDVAPEQTFSLGQSKSSGLLTLTGQPLNGETVTIDTKVYTFQAALTEVDGNVKIGSSAQESLQNLRRAINKDVGAGIDYAALTTAHPTVSAENEAGLSLPVLAKVPGAGGDSIVTTETLTNGSWGGATLSGGGTSQTYRIFPNIARNAKNHFFCIKEV
jgi:hypothetical protein